MARVKKTVKQAPRMLKAFHVFSVSVWLGSSLSLLVLFLGGFGNADIGQLLETERMMYWILLVPGAVGVLATAILFSATTNLGFFKIRGIIIAYAVVVLLLLGGALMLLPQLNGMIHIAEAGSSGALANPDFAFDRNVAQVFLVVQSVFLSVGLFSPKSPK